MNLYFIGGASGSGKTAVIPYLKELFSDVAVHDFDDIGVPENADKIWRQESTEKWLQKLLAKEEDAIAEPQPKVLNFASLMRPVASSTSIWRRITSPHSGAPTRPVPTFFASLLSVPTLRGLLKWSSTFSEYAMMWIG
mgnify:CR=1 FL=1